MRRTPHHGTSTWYAWARSPYTRVLTVILVTACLCNGFLLLWYHNLDHALPHVSIKHGKEYVGSSISSAWNFQQHQQRVSDMAAGNPTKVGGVMHALANLGHHEHRDGQGFSHERHSDAVQRTVGKQASARAADVLSKLYNPLGESQNLEIAEQSRSKETQESEAALLFPRPKRQILYKSALTETVETVEIPTTLSDPMLELPDPAVAQAQTDWPVWWFAPFFDRTSFGKEAATLVLGMMRSGAVPEDNIWVGTSQGNCNYGVDDSMPGANFKQLDAANHRWNMSVASIIVCHSLPPFWARPKNKWETCFPCPPVGYTPAVTIGRAMAETDVYHPEFVKNCNRMDEVWVPSDFSRDVLISSGVEADKLRIVPIAVNTTLFNPAIISAVKLPIGDLVFGRHRRPLPWQHGQTEFLISQGTQQDSSSQDDKGNFAKQDVSKGSLRHTENRKVLHTKGLPDDLVTSGDNPHPLGKSLENAEHNHMGNQVPDWIGASTDEFTVNNRRKAEDEDLAYSLSLSSKSAPSPAFNEVASGKQTSSRARKPFVLFSCFKWEMRKGWDVLLSAYLQEFTSDDHVELYILTKPFLTGSNFTGDMQEWVRSNLPLTTQQRNRLPTLYVISNHLTDQQYAGIYKAADAFVLATRGEGWGMPISEAMAMGLPVVVTNWSGVTGFVDETTGYMVDYELSKVPSNQPWWFQGARWADAKVDSMRARLREVFSDRKETARRGKLARERMVSKYSPEALGLLLAKEFERVKDLLRSGKQCGSKCHNKTWVAPVGDRKNEYYTGDEPFMPKKHEVQKAVEAVLAVNSNVNKDGDGSMADDVSSVKEFVPNGLMSLNKMVAAATATGNDRVDAWRGLIAGAESASQKPLKGIVTELEIDQDESETE